MALFLLRADLKVAPPSFLSRKKRSKRSRGDKLLLIYPLS